MINLATKESRRRSYAVLMASGATRTEIALYVSKAIKAAAKENGWSEDDVGLMLLELNADLDNIFNFGKGGRH